MTPAPAEPVLFERIFRTALTARERGESEVAISGFRRTTILEPSDPRGIAAIASVERSLGNSTPAICWLDRAAIAAPLDPSTRYMQGNALLEAGALKAGRRAFRRSLAARPANAEALGNLGNLEIESADHDAAERVLSRALMIDPHSGVAASFLGETRLARGDFQTGWPLYFARMQTAHEKQARDGLALWDGAPLGPGELLLRGDGGLGDVLMHARFLGETIPGVSRVTLQCHDPLVDLLRGALAPVSVIGKSEDVPSAGAWLPLSMLAGRIGAEPKTSGFPHDYLVKDVTAPQPDPARGPRIGLCWTGQTGTYRQRKRTFPADVFDRLADLDGLVLLSLQVGLGDDAPRPALEMVDRTRGYLGAEGMVRMARDMANLDLVITVDTYVAHLAGALGIETWTLLPHGPEWRWGIEDARTLWYPRARLFRQPSAGDWDTVMQQVLLALSARGQ
jgi:hypothetical protein